MVVLFLYFTVTIKKALALNALYNVHAYTCLIVISTPAGIFVCSNSINIGANVDDKFSICMHVRHRHTHNKIPFETMPFNSEANIFHAQSNYYKAIINIKLYLSLLLPPGVSDLTYVIVTNLCCLLVIHSEITPCLHCMCLHYWNPKHHS